MKYIYFEVHSINGAVTKIPNIQNLNILRIEPITNSIGFWANSRLTQSTRFDNNLIIDQVWINLDKYVFGNDLFKELDSQVKECVSLLKDKYNLKHIK